MSSSSNESGACGGASDADSVRHMFGKATLHDDEENYSSTEERDICPNYLHGSCLKCDVGYRPHGKLEFKSGCRWKDRERNILRILNFPVGMSFRRSNSEIISAWLICPTIEEIPDSDIRRTLRSLQTPQLKRLVDTVLRVEWSDIIDRDPFLWLVYDFSKKYDMKNTPHGKLLRYAETDYRENKDCKVTYNQRSALFSWIETCKLMELDVVKLPELHLDDLLYELIRCAAEEVDLQLVVKLRESSERQIVVCSQTVTVQSNIKVSALAKDILHVITYTENKSMPRGQTPSKMEEFLGQVAAEGLAVAQHSPYGNESYKTVYNMSLFAVHTDHAWKLIAYAIQCHFSKEMIANMAKCPIPNPLKKSVILHDDIEFTADMHGKEIITFLYSAFKGFFTLFKMQRNDDA
ncbi:uncharacterized protein [Ptychodera flava]|uniref:uncharacterized protein n=1 Tax=Ptychodera flava TaxID=63121 RepID=UPI003969DCDB